MEELPNVTQTPKKTHSQVLDVVGILVSIGVVFFMVFLVMQINNLERTVEEQRKLTVGIKDKIYTEPTKEVQKEVHYVDRETFVNYISRRGDNISDVKFDAPPSGFVEIYKMNIDNCQPGMGGLCASTLSVYARPNWQSVEGDQPFYMSGKPDVQIVYYGPFMDDLQRLMREAKHIKTFTDLVE